ncbi:heme exporter protein CcmD [Candidatus Venteria ishoeyi]|uniref:Heme exporter protein D n=1 Tax=Candidatus Venteria ishoeyi TaxID=1899563 RepID=A0A1H6F6V8_9GAMM|nr:heme exporter protein CcmD [Candidatus Venteria ishoeyi]MDM8547820.1 heme exporter protein CcmD [Candidatus Venteria ishoeyi]SEH05868.1 Heme exporter protein D (CcmD) [Candidatus Venteria ishoeyi]
MEAVQEFFHMGGYAFYVWASYGIAAVVLFFNWMSPILREREIKKGLARKVRRSQR